MTDPAIQIEGGTNEMLQTISSNPGVAAGFMALLIAVIGYFLKKILTKIDDHSSIINTLQNNLTLQLADARIKFREDVITIFNSTCSERQGSCSQLQDSKLHAIQVAQQAMCSKLAKLDETRKEQWNKLEDARKDQWGQQRRWNERIEGVVYSERFNTMMNGGHLRSAKGGVE